MNPLKSGLSFVKKYPDIIYSLLLIVLIPLALYLNTHLAIKNFQKEIDINLQTKALIAERIFDIFARDIVANPQLLQEKTEKIIKENPEDIVELQIEIRKEEDFETIALYPPKTEEEISEARDVLKNLKAFAWQQKPDESLGFQTSDEKGIRYWNIVKIIQDSSGKKIGLVTMKMSLKRADERVVKVIRSSYTILTVAILLCLFLIFNHTRLFEYSVLFKKLQEVDKMKDEFISMAAHELRTPITAIRGYSDILRSELASTLSKTQSQHLSRIIISTERLNDLISDILDVSRIEQGRLSFEFQEISPQKIIKEVVNELKVKADEKGLQLIFEAKEEPYLIYADPARLKQILINLIGNAIKYTFQGKVEIETKIDEIKKRYSISIKDTGLGMSAEAQKKLFEKFYRVKTRETAEIPGTGLGLWITKQLCEKMQGEIFLESMEGVGSKFTIVFPLIIKKQGTPAV